MKKYWLLILFSGVALLIIFIYQYIYFYDNKLHVVFCNVGQGDAIFIRTPGGSNILIDGGPDKSVLSCLGEQMPFWERTIDIMILTHPHADHFVGLVYALDRYITLSFVSEKLVNKTQSYGQLSRSIAEKKIPQRMVYEGDRYRLGEDILLTVEAPSKEFLQRTSPGGVIGESHEFASLILKLTYKDFDLLLTGDAQAEALAGVVSEGQEDSLEVLQVPHHGSKTGLNKTILEIVDPELAVFSVGGKNRYGHPHKEVLNALAEKGVQVLRTDQKGSIEIVSDGKKWWVSD